MKKVVILKNESEINLNDVARNIPVFACKDGKLIGLVVCLDDHSWQIRAGGSFHYGEKFKTRQEALEAFPDLTFYVDVDVDAIIDVCV